MSIYKAFKKYHKWPSLVFSLFFLIFAVTGILMNHRRFIASVDINRDYLPSSYKLSNWNLASVKGAAACGTDSIIIYGGAGIWLTNTQFNSWQPKMEGIPNGSDYRKIFDFQVTPWGWYAATRFGLYYLPINAPSWVKLALPDNDEFATSIELVDSSLYITTRNSLYALNRSNQSLSRVDLIPPLGAKNSIGLFRVFWITHSGEVLGDFGRILADIVGLIMIFLSITGFIYFLAPKIIKRLYKKVKFQLLKSTTRFSFKWHLKIGAISALFLVISGITGIFLRPPFLVAIANSKIDRGDNFEHSAYWHDKIRDLRFDQNRNIFILATSDGLYYCKNLDEPLVKFSHQPPVSVMGINVMEPVPSGNILIGSFTGLFLWNPDSGDVINYMDGSPYKPVSGLSRPVGDILVSGYAKLSSGEYVFDYNSGIMGVNNSTELIKMPTIIEKSYRFPLWNLAQEFHTGRYFSAILGDFYILIVPFTGLALALVSITGFVMWFIRRSFKA
ncbi:PepSY-associated TM helix domain-containing protein [Tenuifilum thalassicum]|uniref:PepSY domain-containing protein n=1 Tax=Tenuifilum thalassicum TaxID=2590900 RepID=A0A7D3Y416_9BACT|nr:PepSY-associated TM helix domain-containing protein [Tenuifilum thalassicum]QKG79689.1 PepSY domain-containing protein [Tenuifilum thalassicum]